MPRSKKKGTRKGSAKVGYFIALFGDDPIDDDNLPNVCGTLNAAIDDAKDSIDDHGDTLTIYELVPRARVELPEAPEMVVTRL